MVSELEKHVSSLLRRLHRHRERYVRAWTAATGIPPEQAVLVTRVTVENGVEARWEWAQKAPFKSTGAMVGDLRGLIRMWRGCVDTGASICADELEAYLASIKST